jgi:uncharacterized glyoxalase superfamily protein PhnB
VTIRHIVPIIKVSNIRSAIEFYCTGIGFAKDFEYSATPKGPHYAGLSLDGNQLHLSTFPGDGVGEAATYYYVDDIDALYSSFRARGLTTEMEPTDQDWGMREVYLRDPDGNNLRFGSAIENTG